MHVNHAYLIALEEKLSILISHGHDDHCDDELLSVFDKNTKIITSDFKSPGVKNRLSKIGFKNIYEVGKDGKNFDVFHIKSFRNEKNSLDDALYTICTPDSAIIHANDIWREFPKRISKQIKSSIKSIPIKNRLYMSQTNIASGFPIIYNCYTKEEKEAIQKEHVSKIIIDGLKNAYNINALNFHSYAGMAIPFVKGKDYYLESSIYPSFKYITDNINSDLLKKVKILDFYPGDIYNFQEVKRSFFDRTIYDKPIRDATIKYYKSYKLLDNCDSYQPPCNFKEKNLKIGLHNFSVEFEKFVSNKVERTNFCSTIIGKVLEIHIPELKTSKTIKFGKGVIKVTSDYNKKLIVDADMMWRVISGKSLFENLITGYLAEIDREPKDIYNRDIFIYIIMFSYFYINRILKTSSLKSLTEN